MDAYSHNTHTDNHSITDDHSTTISQGNNYNGITVAVNNGTIAPVSVKLIVIYPDGEIADFIKLLEQEAGKGFSDEERDKIIKECSRYLEAKEGKSALYSEVVKNINELRVWQKELIEARRRELFEVTREENIREELVLFYARKLLELVPGDVLARFYLLVSENNAQTVNAYLDDMDVVLQGKETVCAALDYLLEPLEPRMEPSLRSLAERAFQEGVFKRGEYLRYITAIEGGKSFDPLRQWDLFIAYSSKDRKEVDRLVKELEEQEIECFVAYRDLPHGRGAGGQRYWNDLKCAMGNSRGLVFISTPNSRSRSCDAIEREDKSVDGGMGELPYYGKNFSREEKLRIEYRPESDKNTPTPRSVEQMLKRFFGEVNYCQTPEEVAEVASRYLFPQLYGEEESLLGTKNEKGETTHGPKEQDEKPKLEPQPTPKSAPLPQPTPDYPTLKHNDETEFRIEGTELKKYLKKDFTGEVHIPNDVTSIGECAFSECSLTDIKIPNHVTNIGHGAFYKCKSINKVTLPNNISSIGARAFEDCISLKSIWIPRSVISIEAHAFNNCNQVIIYCEAEKQPDGWAEDWNYANRPVVWDFNTRLKEIEEGKEFTVICNGCNESGLIAEFWDYSVFVPANEIRSGYVRDLEKYIGKKLRLRLLEIRKERRKEIIASQRVILEEERAARETAKAEKEVAFFDSIQEGDIVEGKVERVTSFGAFVSVNGFECLAHISDLSWTGVKAVTDVLEIGKRYEFKVLRVDREGKKVSIGYKQLQPQPWDLAAEKYAEGDIVHGKVVRIVPFGAFVELEKGVDGLVHVSQITHERLENPTSALSIGEEVDAKILAFNPAERKITLSIKALQPRPEAESRPEREPRERRERRNSEGEDRPRTRKAGKRNAESEEEDEYREWNENASFSTSISELLGNDDEDEHKQ